MAPIVGYYLFALSVALLGVMVWQSRQQRCELFSIRNVALAGFIVFQMTSAAIHMISGDYVLMRISDPDSVAVTYAIMVTVFLVIAFLSYRLAPGTRTPARVLAQRKGDAGSGFLLSLAFAMTIAALVMRFGVLIPWVGIAANLVGVGFAAVACGLAGWCWGRRLANPMLLLTVVAIVIANGAIVMWGEFGRRNLVAVSGALLWGVYYSRLRYMPMRQLLTRAALIGVIPFIFIALYSSVRSSSEGGRSVVDHLAAMKDGSVIEGTALLLEGQATGTVAMWAVENFPENYEYKHMLTPTYFLIAQVPRAWWEGKPRPLSNFVANYANVRGVDQGRVLLPAGIIGNAAAEGGWYALIIYGFLAGVFLRFFDELIRQNPASPFIVLPVGCQLGQILGLARGETALFANQYVIALTGVWLTMSLAARLLDSMGVSRDSQAFAEPSEQEWTDYGDESWHEAHSSGDHAA